MKINSAIMRVERMDHPSQISTYNINHKQRLRFTVVAQATTSIITYQNLLDAILMATTAIVGFDIFDLVKIRSVEVWGLAALGTPSTVSVVFTTATGDQSVHTDTSLGVKPAYVLALPSDKSLASFWTASAGGSCFTLTAPAGSIIDVSCSFKTTEFAAVQAQNALVGATAGELYFRGLDGIAIATTNFPPINSVARI